MPFSAFDRTDNRPKRAREPSFQFLDRSARPEMAAVREVIIDAISRYPVAERDELVARLRSGNETHFRSGTFELFLHEALMRLGFTLIPHPDPGTGVSKRPDFLVTAPDGNQFVLEAVLASERDGSSEAAEAMKAATFDHINATPHHSFMIEVSGEGNPITQPPAAALRTAVHQWLDTLDYQQLRAQFEGNAAFDRMPVLHWEHEAWQLDLRAIPLSPERRGKAQQLIGLHDVEFRWVNACEPLRNAVKKKGNRYGPLAVPYVVAVNADIFHLDNIDEVQALYGEEYWSEAISHPELSGPRRYANGAWRGPHGPQHRTVSAVWFFNDLTPTTLAQRHSTLYLNPWAFHPLPSNLITVPTCFVSADRLERLPGRPLASILGLSAHWPGQ